MSHDPPVLIDPQTGEEKLPIAEWSKEEETSGRIAREGTPFRGGQAGDDATRCGDGHYGVVDVASEVTGRLWRTIDQGSELSELRHVTFDIK